MKTPRTTFGVAYLLAAMPCPYCDEHVTIRDKITDQSGLRFHTECFTRLIVGSARHQLRQCYCYGFTAEEEPLVNGLTKRRWARRATAMFAVLRGRSPDDPTVIADVMAHAAATGTAATPDTAYSV